MNHHFPLLQWGAIPKVSFVDLFVRLLFSRVFSGNPAWFSILHTCDHHVRTQSTVGANKTGHSSRLGSEIRLLGCSCCFYHTEARNFHQKTPQQVSGCVWMCPLLKGKLCAIFDAFDFREVCQRMAARRARRTARQVKGQKTTEFHWLRPGASKVSLLGPCIRTKGPWSSWRV